MAPASLHARAAPDRVTDAAGQDRKLVHREEQMLPSGRVVFGEMDEVVFGKPAAEAVAAR